MNINDKIEQAIRDSGTDDYTILVSYADISECVKTMKLRSAVTAIGDGFMTQTFALPTRTDLYIITPAVFVPAGEVWIARVCGD